MEITKRFISTWGADFGGTEICPPFNDAVNLITDSECKNGRIFVLTDGQDEQAF